MTGEPRHHYTVGAKGAWLLYLAANRSAATMPEETNRLKAPRVFFLDGASGTGKTTLALMVASHRTDVSLIPRYTTRPKRADSDEREYIFVSKEEFEKL